MKVIKCELCGGTELIKQDGMDAEIIWRFYEMYRALPVGNSAKS
jgi:hypothetical protein